MQNRPANDLHPPAARAVREGDRRPLEGRLDALLNDRLTQRIMMGGDRRARDLMQRVATVLRREMSERGRRAGDIAPPSS